jgi:type VI protein secretion system component VasF
VTRSLLPARIRRCIVPRLPHWEMRSEIAYTQRPWVDFRNTLRQRCEEAGVRTERELYGDL